MSESSFLMGNGRREKDDGCNGTVRTAFPDEKAGFTVRGETVKQSEYPL